MNEKKITEAIKRLSIERKYIALIYLYGSYAKGKTTSLSDIDIAVLLDKKFNPDKYLDIQIDLMNKLEPAFKSENVMVTILNEATVLLNYEVIKYGRLLYQRSVEERIYFEVRAMQEYFDTERQRQVNDYFLFKRIKEGKFGDKYRKPQETAR